MKACSKHEVHLPWTTLLYLQEVEIVEIAMDKDCYASGWGHVAFLDHEAAKTALPL